MPKSAIDYAEQKAIEKYKADLSLAVQYQQVGAQFAVLVVRSLILVSGGGIIAILTFIGNFASKDSTRGQPIIDAMASAIFWFGIALFLSVLTAMLGYLSALSQGYGLQKISPALTKNAPSVRQIAILSGLCSLVSWGYAVWLATEGLKKVH